MYLNNLKFACDCVGVEFLAFNVLLHTKPEQKMIGNWFWAPIMFKNPLKPAYQ